MGEFLTGVSEKYPAPLLKGRLTIEGNVVSALMKDMLLLDDTKLTAKDFITSDGNFYFQMLNNLRTKGFYSLDEITILSNLSEEVVARYDELGGWDAIQHQIDLINLSNFDTYIDILYRENILCNMHLDGFNLLQKISINDKMLSPLKLFRKMTAEEVIDWYEARMSTYGTGYSSNILEEEEITEFSDEFIQECKEGIDNGVPFDVADNDINGDPMNCFPFLSNQIMGLQHGTFSMIGGFSSAGKSSFFITIIMALIHQGEKVLIVTNEENVKKFKIKFLVWMLAKYKRYYGLTKSKLTSGNITEEDEKHLNVVRKYWKDNYAKKIKIISIADSDISLLKKKVRENVLRYNYSTIIYDTFKIEESAMSGTRQDLSLVKDSRELHKMAKKYNIIMLASVQLAEYMRGTLFLTASVLSNCKQLKEILENLLLMRTVFSEELDPKSKYYCKPYRMKKIGDKWIQEDYELDPDGVYRVVFIEKSRNGSNSSDMGSALIYKFDGAHTVFREVAWCKPKHGEIR